MAWRRSGDKPLSEPVVVNLLTHICVTRPQWVKEIFLHENLSLILRAYHLLQWNFDQNLYIFIQENTFENVVCEMAAILSWPQCVNAGPSEDNNDDVHL